MGLQGKEFIWIFLAIVILFGAKKIPDLMKGVGQGIREFKNASKGEEAADTPPSDSEKIENK
jgi:sec-independent protein translocase protein TatA